MVNKKVAKVIASTLLLSMFNSTITSATEKIITKDYSLEYSPVNTLATSFEGNVKNTINYNGTLAKSSDVIVKNTSVSSDIYVRTLVRPLVKDSSGNFVAMQIKYNLKGLGDNWELHDDGYYYYTNSLAVKEETTQLCSEIRLADPTWYELKTNGYTVEFNIISESIGTKDVGKWGESKLLTDDGTLDYYPDYKGFNFWVAGSMTLAKAEDTFKTMTEQDFNAITIMPNAFFYEDTGTLVPELNPDNYRPLQVSFDDLVALATKYFEHVVIKPHFSGIKLGETKSTPSIVYKPSSKDLEEKFLAQWSDLIKNRYIPLSNKYGLDTLFLGNESNAFTGTKNTDYWNDLIDTCHKNNLKTAFSFAGFTEYEASGFADNLDSVGLNIYINLNVNVDNDLDATMQAYSNTTTYPNLQKLSYECKERGQKLWITELGSSRNTAAINNSAGYNFTDEDDQSDYAQYQQYYAFMHNFADVDMLDGIFLFCMDYRREGSAFTPYAVNSITPSEKLLIQYKRIGGNTNE